MIFIKKIKLSIIQASFGVALVWVAILAVSLHLTLHDEKEKRETVSLETARAFFEQILITRAWNALHGGMYVPVTHETVPNPYLNDPHRDVITEKGVRLTKINPAYMTRQIAEIAANGTGVQFHITSLNPIRPKNVPLPWEKEWLSEFHNGEMEKYAYITENGTPLFRYMAPLKTDAACLKCHAKQGYQVGDVRGGISITLPFVQSGSHLFVFLGYGFAAVIGTLIILLGGLLLNRKHHHLVAVNEKLEGKNKELRHSHTVLQQEHHDKLIAEAALQNRNKALEIALKEVKTLKGLIPICSHCKKIRDDQGLWNQLEAYLCHNSEAEFSHGICPECVKKYYSDLYEDD